jgi:hypothetical protein
VARERSVWTYVIAGCALAILVGGLVLVGGALWFYRGMRKLEAELKDPAARTEGARKILGAERLPEGYHAMLALSIPFVMRIAVLTTDPPGPQGQIQGFGAKGFVYAELIGPERDEEQLRDYFEGRTSDASVLRRSGVSIDAGEVLGRGVVPVGEARLLYVAQRGGISVHGAHGRGITSIVLVDCPADDRVRTAVWFAPDPAPEAAAAALDLAGTPADEAALAAFVGQFRFCG